MNFDLKTFIETVGYLGVFFIIFAESGLLIGFLRVTASCSRLAFSGGGFSIYRC